MQARALGRRQPQAQFDYGHFKGVVCSGGQLRFFPRLSAHYNAAHDTVPPPAGPLGRAAKAQKAIAEMYRNDVEGDCVIASRLHALGVLSGNESGSPLLATSAECDTNYHAACGPGDNGCDMSVVNDYWQKTGLLVAGGRHKSDGSAAVDHTNRTLVEVAIDVFGTLDVGMNLPNAWYTSADGSDWGPVSGAAAAIVGGHEVQAFDYDSQGVWIATWAGTRRILWAAFTSRTWIDECYTTLVPEWYANGNLAPNGINAVTLKADLALVASGQVPPLPDGPTPVPPTPGPTPVPPPPAPMPSAFDLTQLPWRGQLAVNILQSCSVHGQPVQLANPGGAGDSFGFVVSTGRR